MLEYGSLNGAEARMENDLREMLERARAGRWWREAGRDEAVRKKEERERQRRPRVIGRWEQIGREQAEK